MIKSMTGFGAAQDIIGQRSFIVEIKSVNSRYFEFSSKISKGYAFLEENIKSTIKSRVSRGKIDLYLKIEDLNNDALEVLINDALAKSYIESLRTLKSRYNLSGDVSISDIAIYHNLFSINKTKINEDMLWNEVNLVLEKAMEKFISARILEGEQLNYDIEKRIYNILKFIQKIESRSSDIVSDYKNKLEAKIRDLLNDEKIDDQRILTEVAIFADKMAIDEEIVRIKSHLEHFKSLLCLNEAVGRKLDFITQEMNREVNTIGSKILDYEISSIVVEIKSELEKIREQIQNIE